MSFSAQPGDLVVVLHGGNVPYVLREGPGGILMVNSEIGVTSLLVNAIFKGIWRVEVSKSKKRKGRQRKSLR